MQIAWHTGNAQSLAVISTDAGSEGSSLTLPTGSEIPAAPAKTESDLCHQGQQLAFFTSG